MSSDPEPPVDQLELERLRAWFELRLAEYRQKADSDLEMFRSVISAGTSARQATLLINGGAAAGLLAFIGHLATDPIGRSLVPGSAAPLGLFISGLLAGAVASGTTYLAQASWSRGREKVGRFWNGTSIALVLASYILFALGCAAAFRTISSFRP